MYVVGEVEHVLCFSLAFRLVFCFPFCWRPIDNDEHQSASEDQGSSPSPFGLVFDTILIMLVPLDNVAVEPSHLMSCLAIAQKRPRLTY